MSSNEKVKKFADLQPGFNQTAEALSNTDFVNYLQCKFGDKTTTSAVLDVFEKMEVPIPETGDEFMDGTEGALVFLNRYGLVIRIERESDFKESSFMPDRINDSPWILKPLASINAGKVVIEICPGCFQEKGREKLADLFGKLYVQNIKFWDTKFSNIGRVPVNAKCFPEGILVVIDRLAVARLTDSMASVRLSLEELEEVREAGEAQEKLYGPLRQAFDTAWSDNQEPDNQKMKQFWDICRKYKKEEKLVAGWNEPQSFDDEKVIEAKNVAAVYEDRLKSVEQTVTPAAAVVPQ